MNRICINMYIASCVSGEAVLDTAVPTDVPYLPLETDLAPNDHNS